MKRRFNFWQKMKRLCRYRLVIPLLRSPHPPKYKARGIAVGVAWAMTPLVGIQMAVVGITWVIAKYVFRWNFSWPLALAYTWITNVFTMIPIYYAFYVTGQLMMGRPITRYADLKDTMKAVFFADYTFGEKIMASFKLLMQDWGLGMAVGCLPWALFLGTMSYYITMRYEKLRLEMKQKRQMERKK